MTHAEFHRAAQLSANEAAKRDGEPCGYVHTEVGVFTSAGGETEVEWTVSSHHTPKCYYSADPDEALRQFRKALDLPHAAAVDLGALGSPPEATTESVA
jgi:hypothetical protein